MNFLRVPSYQRWLAVCIASLLTFGGDAFSSEWTDEARTEVATLDGQPVYHWRAFRSVVPDDVDRALILREFERKRFKLPAKLVDDAVRRQVNEEAGGDADKFARTLREQGASSADFRRFTSEEIILQAMLYQQSKGTGERAKVQARWLATLREQATVKKLVALPNGG